MLDKLASVEAQYNYLMGLIADPAVQAAIKNSDPQNARIECDKALEQAVLDLLTDHTELFKQFSDNPSFKRFVSDAVFSQTYKAA